MKVFCLKFTVASALVLGFALAAPYLAMAGDERQDGQPTNIQEPGPGDPSQAPPPSADVQERGLSLSPGVRPGSQVLQPPPMAFKCSVEANGCRCFGVEDCNWMRRVITRCKISDTCTHDCTCHFSQ